MFRWMLAPMEDYTDNAFRTLCFKYGAELTFTEMAKIDGLARKNKATLNKIKILNSTPTEIQLVLGKEEMLEKFLKDFTPTDGFEGFNFNYGCPAPEITKLGRGCAMVKRISKTNRLIEIVKKYNHSVSIKMRLGETAYEKKMKAYLNLINNTNPDYFIVHARTGVETYSHKSDFSVFAECVDTGKIIIANGDIDTKEKTDELNRIGIQGAMIGRAAVRDPCIFNRLMGARELPTIEQLKKEYSDFAMLYSSDARHKKNVLMRMGQNFSPKALGNDA